MKQGWLIFWQVGSRNPKTAVEADQKCLICIMKIESIFHNIRRCNLCDIISRYFQTAKYVEKQSWQHFYTRKGHNLAFLLEATQLKSARREYKATFLYIT
jgi:hypothetical protein